MVVIILYTIMYCNFCKNVQKDQFSNNLQCIPYIKNKIKPSMTSSKLVYREEVPSGMVQFGTIKLVEVQNELAQKKDTVWQ